GGPADWTEATGLCGRHPESVQVVCGVAGTVCRGCDRFRSEEANRTDHGEPDGSRIESWEKACSGCRGVCGTGGADRNRDSERNCHARSTTVGRERGGQS